MPMVGAPAYMAWSGVRLVVPSEPRTVSYTHLRAHETVLDLVCRLLLEKKNYHHVTLQLRRLPSIDTPTPQYLTPRIDSSLRPR